MSETGKRLRSLCAAAIMILSAGMASAQTVNWNSTLGGTFSVGSNWLGGVAPGAGSIALFDTVGSFYSVTFSSNATIAGLTVNDEGINFRSNIGSPRLLTVSGTTLVQDDLNLNKMSLDTAMLSITAGAILAGLGDSAVTAGTLNMSSATGGQLQLFGGSLTSSLTISGNVNHFVGQNGGTAILRCDDTNGSIAGTLHIASSGVANTQGQFRVEGTSSITLNHLNVGTGVASGQIAQVLVDAGATLFQTGGAITRVGAASTSVASFDVQGGTFSSGTGGFTVNPTGRVKINSGTFFSNGNFTLSGGTMSMNIGTLGIGSDTTFSMVGGTFSATTSTIAQSTNSTISIGGGGKFTHDGAMNVLDSARLIVTGAGSAGTFSAGTLNPASLTSTLSISNGGSLTVFSTLSVGAGTGGAGGTGRVEVSSGGDVLMGGELRIGNNSLGNRIGILSVDGTGSEFVQSTGNVLLGTSSGSAGTIIVSNGGVMTTGNAPTDVTNIGTTGRLLVNGGTFNSGQDMFLSPGAQVIVTDNGSFSGQVTFASGTDVTISNGTLSSSSALALNGVNMAVGGSTASLSSAAAINLGSSGTGASILEVTSFAQLSTPQLNLASGSAVNSDPFFRLGSNAVGTINSAIRIGTNGFSGSDSTFRVDNATLNFSGVSAFNLGTASGSTGTLEVLNGGFFNGTGLAMILANTGTLRVNNAHFKNPSIMDVGGTVLFESGTIELTAGTMTVGNTGLLPTLFTLTPAHYLNVSNTTIEAGGVLSLAGGTLRTGTLAGGGYLNWSSGTVQLTASGATVGPGSPLGLLLNLDPLKTLSINGNLAVGTGGQIEFTGGQLIGAGSLANSGVVLFDVSGYVPFTGNLVNDVFGTMFIGERAVVSVDSQLLNAGRLDFDGGTARLAGAGSITNSGVITGDGYIAIPITNTGPGEIRGEAGKTLIINSFALTNNARIRLLGGTVEYIQGLTNNPLGRIEGHGVFKAASIQNHGTISLSAGLSDFIGTLTNNSGGKVIITGGGTTTFYNNVTNSAGSEFRVSSGATAAFLAPVVGLSLFTGGGTKYFESGASGGPLATSGSSVVEDNATLTAEHIREISLTVRGNTVILPNGTSAGTSRLNLLTIDGGTLDLNDNDLVIDYTGASPINQIQNHLFTGALFSSMADASISPRFALGYMESAGVGTFSGQAVDGTSLLIAYTLRGDGNLDGKVNTLDFNMLAGAFGLSGQYWINGDFSHDGIVDSIDYNFLAGNYGHSTPPPAPGLGSIVPEPSRVVLLLLISILLLPNRRRGVLI